MDIEPSSASLFTPASHSSTAIAPNQTSTFTSPCSLAHQHSSGHFLRVIANSLVLEHQQEPTQVLELTFEVKF